jgi:hypothetical protein
MTGGEETVEFDVSDFRGESTTSSPDGAVGEEQDLSFDSRNGLVSSKWLSSVSLHRLR